MSNLKTKQIESQYNKVFNGHAPLFILRDVKIPSGNKK